jgi:hypothetical protein
MISDFQKAECFCALIWTTQISMIPLTKLAFTRTRWRVVFDRMRDVNREKSIKPGCPHARINAVSA